MTRIFQNDKGKIITKFIMRNYSESKKQAHEKAEFLKDIMLLSLRK